MLERAWRSTHDTTRHVASRRRACRVVTCRDVTQQVEFFALAVSMQSITASLVAGLIFIMANGMLGA